MISDTRTHTEEMIYYIAPEQNEKNYNYEQLKNAGNNLLEACFILDSEKSYKKEDKTNIKELLSTQLSAFSEFMKGMTLSDEEHNQINAQIEKMINTKNMRDRNSTKTREDQIEFDSNPIFSIPGLNNVEVQFYFQDIDKKQEFPIQPSINVVVRTTGEVDFNTENKTKDLKDLSQFRLYYYRDKQPS